MRRCAIAAVALLIFGLPISAATPAPGWSRDAVWYQIFPERFRNGDPANDPSPASLAGTWPNGGAVLAIFNGSDRRAVLRPGDLKLDSFAGWTNLWTNSAVSLESLEVPPLWFVALGGRSLRLRNPGNLDVVVARRFVAESLQDAAQDETKRLDCEAKYG